MKKLQFFLSSLTIALAMISSFSSCNSRRNENSRLMARYDSLQFMVDSLQFVNESLKKDIDQLKTDYNNAQENYYNELELCNASISLCHYVWQNHHNVWNDLKKYPEFNTLDSLYLSNDPEDFFYHWGGCDND